MAALYRREREHEARGSAERARPVSANGGTRRSGLSAGDCCVLWRAAGAFTGGGVVGSEGDTLGGPGRFSSMPSMSHGRGLCRGDRGSTR
jgi:hypothetical protein